MRYYGNYPHVCKSHTNLSRKRSIQWPRLPVSCRTQTGSDSVTGTHAGVGGLEVKDRLLAPPGAWAGTASSKENLHLDNTHFKFSFLLPFEHCVSTDRPPTSKVSQQPPVPPQRPMAALPPLPTGRNHSVSLLLFFLATLYPQQLFLQREKGLSFFTWF